AERRYCDGRLWLMGSDHPDLHREQRSGRLERRRHTRYAGGYGDGPIRRHADLVQQPAAALRPPWLELRAPGDRHGRHWYGRVRERPERFVLDSGYLRRPGSADLGHLERSE